MGLLKRVNEYQKTLAGTVPQSNLKIVNTVNRKEIGDFLSKVKNLDQGFVYSSKLFNLLSNYLDIKKGVLLILEPESKTFVPGSYLHMDITTTRHLRIDSSIFQKQFNSFNEIIAGSQKKIKILKQYFSIREFSALNSIMVVPFYMDGLLSALLLIIDPNDTIVDAAREVSLNSEKFISKLIKSRKPFINTTPDENTILGSEPKTILKDFIVNNTSIDTTILIITMNFEKLLNAILNLLPNSDSYEISSNILKAVSKLISPIGELINISTGNYLLFYKIKKGKSSNIILHQINLAIASFFNLANDLPSIEATIKAVPSMECDSAELLLAGII